MAVAFIGEDGGTVDAVAAKAVPQTIKRSLKGGFFWRGRVDKVAKISLCGGHNVGDTDADEAVFFAPRLFGQ